MTNFSLLNRRYQVQRRLASSLCGKVLLAQDTHENDKLVVCKLSEHYLIDSTKAEDPLSELVLLERLMQGRANQPDALGKKYIITLHRKVTENEETIGVLEYCQGGDLFDTLKQHQISSPKTQIPLAKRWFMQMAYGLHYLHSQNIAHLDFSLENILLTGDGNVRIADFGMARAIDTCPKTGKQLVPFRTKSGKPGYLAPEILEPLPDFSGKAADIFALGVSLFQLLAGVPPFKTATTSDPCWRYIVKGKLQKLVEGWDLADHISPNAVDFLECCFAREEDRITIEEVIKHPFFLGCVHI
jgi:serine/threonine protein kinase